MREWSHDEVKDADSFSPEVRERAVRMVFEHRGEHASQWAAIVLDCGEDRLHGRDAAAAGCARPSATRASAPASTTDERERMKALERENRELRQANEILRKASAYFAQAELDRRFKP